MDICSTRTMRGANCGTDHQMLRSRVIFSIRRKHNQKGAMKPVKLKHKQTEKHQPRGESGAGNGTMPSPNHRKIMTSLAVSNRLCTIPLKHLSANMRRNIKTGSTQTTRFYGIYWLKGDQAHQRVLQIRSTRSAVQASKDACRILQKYTRARKSEWWEMKAEEL